MTKMRFHRILALFAFALSSAAAGRASEVLVLKGGKTLELSKPYVVRGTQAVLTLKDGTVVSVAEAEIDRPATQAARARASAIKKGAEAESVATPAEAARAQKNAAKAKFKVGDDDVSHPYVAPDDEGKDTGDGDARVEVVDWDQTPANGSLSVKGNLRNSGSAAAEGLSLLVMGKDDKGKTLASTSANVAAGTLDAGAVTTFTATLAMPARAASLRFMPKWSSAAATAKAQKALDAESGLARRAAEAAATTPQPASAAPAAAPAPPPPAQPQVIVPPGYAPPTASSPTSAPDDNHVPYVPGIHEETPPPPPPQ